MSKMGDDKCQVPMTIRSMQAINQQQGVFKQKKQKISMRAMN